jgi:SHS2 domain-containing protein
MVYGEFAVVVTGSDAGAERSGGWALAAHVRGEPIAPDRHEPTVEPKGATFMEAKVTCDDEPGRGEADARRGPQWTSQCVVDV